MAVLDVCRLDKQQICLEPVRSHKEIRSLCYSGSNPSSQVPKAPSLLSTAFPLFLLGFFLMFLGVLMIFVAILVQDNTTASGALIIFVGPIPIILGVGPEASLTILLATILTVAGFIWFLWLRRKAFSS